MLSDTTKSVSPRCHSAFKFQCVFFLYLSCFDCCNTTTIPTCENHFLITVLLFLLHRENWGHSPLADASWVS